MLYTIITSSIFFIILLCGCMICNCEQHIGDACHITEKNKSGSCKLLSNCQSALKDIQNRKFPQICGFQGNIPIVCCDEEKKKEEIGKIADKKCWEYSESVYEHILPPVQLLEREYINKSTCTLVQRTLIVGGEDAKEQEFPHMALLGFGRKENINWQCGGTLISEQFVLTAAHCMNTRFGDVKFIRLGELNIARLDDSEHQDFNVIKIIKHPNFLPPSKYDDIGILKMDRKVQFNKFIRPACLQLTKDIPKITYIATGWGINVTGGYIKSDHLQKVILSSYSNEECNEKYKNLGKRALNNGIVDDIQICAGGGKDEVKDTCQGDSGGPLQIYHPQVHCMYSVIGITSFGKSCVGEASIYTRVSGYIEWIENNIWQ